jgi:hypothetical protein
MLMRTLRFSVVPFNFHSAMFSWAEEGVAVAAVALVEGEVV